MNEAEVVIRKTLGEAERPEAPEIGIVCMAASLLGEVLYEFGEFEAVCALLEDRIDFLERISIPDTVLRAMVALSGARWMLGKRADAIALMERLENYAIRQDLPRLLVYALSARLRWHDTTGNVELAQALLGRIVALGARYAGAGPGIGADIHRRVERARAEASLHWKDYDTAVLRFESLAGSLESVGRWRGVAGVRAQLAVALRARGDAARARATLVDALRVGHRFGLTRSLLDASADVPAMLQDLLEPGDLDPLIAFYAKRLLEASARARAWGPGGADAPLVPTGAGRLSERELEVLSLVAQAMPNKKIARVLGVTPHTVKWHLKKIYEKLGVSHRDEAVARMRDVAGIHPAP